MPTVPAAGSSSRASCVGTSETAWNPVPGSWAAASANRSGVKVPGGSSTGVVPA